MYTHFLTKHHYYPSPLSNKQTAYITQSETLYESKTSKPVQQTDYSSDETKLTTKNSQNNASNTKWSVFSYYFTYWAGRQCNSQPVEHLPSDLLSRSLESNLCLFVWGRLQLDEADMNSDTVNTWYTSNFHHTIAIWLSLKLFDTQYFIRLTDIFGLLIPYLVATYRI